MAVLAIEILLLVYFNLFHIKDAVDQDYAKILRHVIEMAKHHTLFLPNWEYLTTGEMDAASLPALLFYLLTKNIYLSYGLAGIVNIAVWAVTVNALLNLCRVSLKYRLLAFCLLFTAYDFGMLAYTNMMFFAGGQYVYKTLVPVLLIILLIKDNTVTKPKAYWFFAVLYCILLFFVCAASKTYVILCGILPIVVCTVIFVLLKQKPELQKHWLITGLLTVVVSLAGLFLNHHYGIQTKSYSLKALEWLVSDHLLTFLELLKVFNPLTTGAETEVFTAAGLMGLVRLGLAAVILGFGFVSLPKVFGIRVYRKIVQSGSETCDIENRLLIETMLISIFAWNYFIQFLTLSTPRYHLIGSIPLMICAVLNLEKTFSKDQVTVMPNLVLSVLTIVLLLVNGYSLIHAERHYFHEEDGYYYLSENLISQMKEQGIDTAFVLDDGRIAERLRVLDTDLVFENYDPENGAVMNYDFYITERDRSAFTDRNIIIGPQSKYDLCPEYIRNAYQYFGDYGEFGIWYSKTNPIDGMSGMYVGDNMIDLATAPYYEYQGTIQSDGTLVSKDSGTILKSPVLVFDNQPVEMTLYYETKGTDAVLELYSGEACIETIPLTEEGTCTVNIQPDYSDFHFAIVKEDTSPFTFLRAEYRTS